MTPPTVSPALAEPEVTCGCSCSSTAIRAAGASASTRPHPEASDSCNTPAVEHPPAGPLAAILGQLRYLLTAMSDAQYVQKPVGAFGSSIGGQTRHTLDHVETLIRGYGAGRIDYDHRARGTDVETNRGSAIAAIDRLRPGLLAITRGDLDNPLHFSVMLASDGASIDMPSCVARELAFVQSHTIHHNAMIAAMAQHLGVPVPDRFGYAPSTVAYLEGRMPATAIVDEASPAPATSGG